MAETTDQIRPLRGPLGWRDLFFTREASPLLAYAKTGIKSMVGEVVVIAALLLLVVWFYAEIHHWARGLEELFYVLSLAAWIVFEIICVASGLRLHWLAAASERRRRISDLTLTQTRPTEICQWLIARRVWTMTLLIILIFGATMLLHLLVLRRHLYFIPLIGVIGANTVVTLYMSTWAQTALFISAPTKITAIRRQFVFYMIYALLVSVFVVAYVAVVVAIASIRHGDLKDYILAWLVLPFAAPFWWMKYKIARAWAERIERVIFYQMEM